MLCNSHDVPKMSRSIRVLKVVSNGLPDWNNEMANWTRVMKWLTGLTIILVLQGWAENEYIAIFTIYLNS